MLREISGAWWKRSLNIQYNECTHTQTQNGNWKKKSCTPFSENSLDCATIVAAAHIFMNWNSKTSSQIFLRIVLFQSKWSHFVTHSTWKNNDFTVIAIKKKMNDNKYRLISNSFLCWIQMKVIFFLHSIHWAWNNFIKMEKYGMNKKESLTFDMVTNNKYMYHSQCVQ